MWDHQRREVEDTAHLEYHALWWQQRTGKSRVIIDTAAYLYEARFITALTIGAYPSNVHRNWGEIEIPTYLPERVPRKVVIWQSSKMSGRVAQENLAMLLEYRGLAILCFNCEALTQSRLLWPYLQKLIHKRRAMAVADEADWLASPGAARSKRALAWARRAVVRRVCNGTPTEESPFAAYSQTNFLKPGLLGFTSAMAFRAHYGEYEAEIAADGSPVLDTLGNPVRKKHYNHRTGTTYEVQTGYRNLDELKEKMLRFGSRVLRSDCADLPEKIYRKVHFDLAPEQRRSYDELRDAYQTEIANGTVRAVHPLTRLGRLQMITRGYWPEETVGEPCPMCAGAGCETCEDFGIVVRRMPRRLIPTAANPAIEALTAELEALGGAPVICWARYRWDVTDCVEAAERIGRKVVRYDGLVKSTDRAANQRAFQAGEVDTLVGTTAAGGRGIRLDRAEVICYYSNSFSLIQRMQSEDRAESLTMTRGTGVIDLIARDTVDEHIVDTLRGKKSIAEAVMGDKHLEWI